MMRTNNVPQHHNTQQDLRQRTKIRRVLGSTTTVFLLLINVLILLQQQVQVVNGYINITTVQMEMINRQAGAPSPGSSSNNKRCIGLQADFAKLDDIRTSDLEQIQNPSGNRRFEITSVSRINRADGVMLKDRVRLVERIDDIPVRGADVVVNFRGCESGICAREVESLRGKTFRDVSVRDGTASNKTREEVTEQIMKVFGAKEDGVGELSLEIFASTNGDYLAYFTDVLVETEDGDVKYFNVIVDAHSVAFLSICNLVGLSSLREMEIARAHGLGLRNSINNNDVGPPVVTEEAPDIVGRNDDKPPPKGPPPPPPHRDRGYPQNRHQRRRRGRRHLRTTTTTTKARSGSRDLAEGGGQQLFSSTGIRCGSCAEDSKGVTWGTTHSSCPINSLYLDNDGRETICVDGTTQDGQAVWGAGPVPDLYWGGTQDCKSTTNQCQTTILPTCSDAISDVQYAAIKTLQYFQEYLGVMGGLSESSEDPIPIKANVHYNENYCNAFYRYSANTVFFGDCDCSYWTPLTSVDIVAHEMAHGVTKHSSGLEYQYEAGGMNEAFSDIVGTVVEFIVDDSVDKPDFQIGEMLGNRLRAMEYPGEVGRSISSVCEYHSNLEVHHTSGPLNKAFVNAVRACESNGCSDLKDCTMILGSIFMYANIQSLTTYSGYLDGADATCGIVDEYYAVKSPTTTCSEDYVVTFIRQGWYAVNVSLDESCQARKCCEDDCPIVPPAPQQPTPSPTTGPPTTPMPTLQPTQPRPTQTPSPTPEEEDIEGSEENIILRIYKMLQNLFKFLTFWRRGDDGVSIFDFFGRGDGR